MKQAGYGSSDARRERFARDGYLSPVRAPAMDAAEAASHRERMERAEAVFGDLHYQAKVQTVLRSPLELATHPKVLETVTALIGPDALLWNATYIVKEPDATAHVSAPQPAPSASVSFLRGVSPRAPRLKAPFLRGVSPRAPRLKAPFLRGVSPRAPRLKAPFLRGVSPRAPRLKAPFLRGVPPRKHQPLP